MNSLELRILKVLKERGPLGTMQICRCVNGISECPLKYNPRTGWMDRVCDKCRFKPRQVLHALKCLKAKGLVRDFHAWVFEEGPKAQKNLSGELYHFWDIAWREEVEVIGP